MELQPAGSIAKVLHEITKSASMGAKSDAAALRVLVNMCSDGETFVVVANTAVIVGSTTNDSTRRWDTGRYVEEIQIGAHRISENNHVPFRAL